ncbi:MAG: MFS transporter [Thermoplasmata archaeon]
MNRKWYILLSTSGGFFLWGVIASVAPLATSWSIFNNPIFTTIALITGPVFMLAGNYIMGHYSDVYGRKKIFIITILIYAAGSLVIYFSVSFLMFEIGLALANFGIGGEEPPSLAILSENFEPSERKYTLTLIPNMFNVGGLILAYISMMPFFSQENVQRIPFLMISLISVILLLMIRISVPESYLWLKKNGMENESEILKKELNIKNEGIKKPLPSKALIYTVLILLGISQYMSFWLLALAIGPYYYPENVGIIVFVSMLGATIGGFLSTIPLKLGKKKFVLFSFSAGLISMIILIPFIKELGYFLIILFINMIFSEFGWVSRTNLEPELFETLRRSRGIATVRIIPITLYIIMLYLSAHFTIFEFIIINVILWSVGVIASIIWYFRGIETMDISLNF